MRCIGDNTLAALIDGQLAEERRRQVDEHLDACERCRALVAALAPHAAHAAEEEDETVPATRNKPVEESVTKLHVRPDSAEPLLRDGLEVDHYTIVRRLGRGGMGEVYLARDSKLARKVALKIISPGFFGTPDALARFLHEARMMARLSHPNIVTVHAVGEFRKMPYVAMEFVDGSPLDTLLQSRTMTEQEVVDHARAIADALAAAHERGVVHRDLKPANVMVGTDGRVRVLDFGLARVADTEGPSDAPTLVPVDDPVAIDTHSGGTPHYMAPEQWAGLGTGPATDIWALGVIVHELLVGETPFEHARNLGELAGMANAGGPHVRPELKIADELRDFIERCMRHDAVARPSIAEVRESLDAIAETLREEAKLEGLETVKAAKVPTEEEMLAAAETLEAKRQQPPPAANGVQKGAGERRWVPVAAALVIGGIVGALIVAATSGGDDPSPAPSPNATSTP